MEEYGLKELLFFEITLFTYLFLYFFVIPFLKFDQCFKKSPRNVSISW